MRDKINNFFMNISDKDIRQHNALVRKERTRTNGMLIREANRLQRKGF